MVVEYCLNKDMQMKQGRAEVEVCAGCGFELKRREVRRAISA